MSSLLERPEARLAVAVVVGLLIGAEREQRHREETQEDRPGIRTFALVAMVGAVAALFGDPWLLSVLGLAVAGGAIARFVKADASDAGLTSEIALLLTYGLGAETDELPAYMVLSHPGGLPTFQGEHFTNGWLPALYQGTLIRPTEPRILNLDPPPSLAGSPAWSWDSACTRWASSSVSRWARSRPPASAARRCRHPRPRSDAPAGHRRVARGTVE